MKERLLTRKDPRIFMECFNREGYSKDGNSTRLPHTTNEELTTLNDGL